MSAQNHFTAETLARFQRELDKYPTDQKASAVIACLSILQQQQGFVTPQDEQALAQVLEMPVMAVHEVFTFYNMFNQQPVGQFKINVCTNLPCQLRGGQKALEHLCQKLGIESGKTTADGRFTLQPGECMGACADAPVLLVNDRHMCSFMGHDKLNQLIDGLQSVKAGT
jgi:NADH-quinone oxidoreductase subunit E